MARSTSASRDRAEASSDNDIDLSNAIVEPVRIVLVIGIGVARCGDDGVDVIAEILDAGNRFGPQRGQFCEHD